MISMVFSVSDLLRQQVFLIEQLSNQNRERLPHLHAVVFVRPTESNITLIKEEMAQPRYSEYHLCTTAFSLSQ